LNASTPSGATPNAPGRLSVRWILPLVLAVAAGAFLLGRQDSVGTSGGGSEVIDGSGIAATETRSLPAFTAVDLAGASRVTVRVGAEPTVVVRADDNLIGRIETDVRQGVLVVSERGSFGKTLPSSVEVTVRDLDSVRLTGSGTISVEGVRARTFTAELLGSGVLEVAGSVDELEATLTGSGSMSLGFLVARSVTASVPGSGRLEVQATHELDASVPGSGVVVYAGRPATVTRSVTGSGAIVPR
jgi:hypothetical protein